MGTSPSLCDPGAIKSGAFDSGTSSRWTRSVTISFSTEIGGATCCKPFFVVQGPKPSTSTRLRTQIVRSWCHPKDQFTSALLSKKTALTGWQKGPSAVAATPPIGAVKSRKGVKGAIALRRKPALWRGRCSTAAMIEETISKAAPGKSCAPSAASVRGEEFRSRLLRSPPTPPPSPPPSNAAAPPSARSPGSRRAPRSPARRRRR